MTVYTIDRKRGYEASIQLLNPDYAGVLVHDGWRPYDRFFKASHQTCLAHPLRRCHELLETATRGAVHFPRQIKAMLKEALAVRDQYAADELTLDQVAAQAEALRRQLLKRITPRKTHPGNDKLAAHLYRHQNQLCTFLHQIDQAVDATHWRAKQALRPAVVNREVWGGNRTDAGAHAQSILMSILAACRQQHHDPLDWLSRRLRGQPPPRLV
jgi:transposase